MTSKRAAVAEREEAPVQIRFGGWYDGDNHKPFRGWYYICRCGHVGAGQLLSASAHGQWLKHRNGCARREP